MDIMQIIVLVLISSFPSNAISVNYTLATKLIRGHIRLHSSILFVMYISLEQIFTLCVSDIISIHFCRLLSNKSTLLTHIYMYLHSSKQKEREHITTEVSHYASYLFWPVTCTTQLSIRQRWRSARQLSLQQTPNKEEIDVEMDL